MEIIIYNNIIYRPCFCNSGIIAEASATTKGMAKISG